jgi:hypothetical protein
MACHHLGKICCDEECVAYVAAHECADDFVRTDCGYTADIALDFFRFCDINDETVKLSKETWKDLRDRIIQAQRSAYVSGFFHGWEHLDYEKATLDWLDGPDT